MANLVARYPDANGEAVYRWTTIADFFVEASLAAGDAVFGVEEFFEVVR